MGNSSYQGVVHTKSSYAPDYELLDNDLANVRGQLQGRWQSLRERENAIYRQIFP